MNRASVVAVLQQVSYPGYVFEVNLEEERMYLRGIFYAPCAETGQMAQQFTRKWYVSREATRSEIVQTALKCVLTSIEHEAREVFQYRGRAIFGPHFDVEQLVALCDQKSRDTRPQLEGAPA
jgi:hypothetical protein